MRMLIAVACAGIAILDPASLPTPPGALSVVSKTEGRVAVLEFDLLSTFPETPASAHYEEVFSKHRWSKCRSVSSEWSGLNQAGNGGSITIWVSSAAWRSPDKQMFAQLVIEVERPHGLPPPTGQDVREEIRLVTMFVADSVGTDTFVLANRCEEGPLWGPFSESERRGRPEMPEHRTGLRKAAADYALAKGVEISAPDLQSIAAIEISASGASTQLDERWRQNPVSVVTALSVLIENRDVEVRRLAVAMIGNVSTHVQDEAGSSRDALLEVVTHAALLAASDVDAKVRHGALDIAVGLLEDPTQRPEQDALVSALVGGLRDKADDVRRTAVIGLARTGRRSLIPDDIAATYAQDLNGLLGRQRN